MVCHPRIGYSIYALKIWALEALYPQFLHHAFAASHEDVPCVFLGPAHDRRCFEPGEVKITLKNRPEAYACAYVNATR